MVGSAAAMSEILVPPGGRGGPNLPPRLVRLAQPPLISNRVEGEPGRTLAKAEEFFEGLELVDPDIVQVHRWRPDSTSDEESRTAVDARASNFRPTEDHHNAAATTHSWWPLT